MSGSLEPASGYDPNGGVIGITGDKEGTAGMTSHQRESLFVEADEDRDERISYEEACRACKRMGIVVDDLVAVIQANFRVSLPDVRLALRKTQLIPPDVPR